MALRLEKETAELLEATRDLLEASRVLARHMDNQGYGMTLDEQVERRAELAIADLDFALHP
jgi:hypothetical protein